MHKETLLSQAIHSKDTSFIKQHILLPQATQHTAYASLPKNILQSLLLLLAEIAASKEQRLDALHALKIAVIAGKKYMGDSSYASAVSRVCQKLKGLCVDFNKLVYLKGRIDYFSEGTEEINTPLCTIDEQ